MSNEPGGGIANDVFYFYTNIGFERWRRLTPLRCAGHPLFGFAGKRGLKVYYLFI